MPLERAPADLDEIDPADIDFERFNRIDELFLALPIALDTVPEDDDNGDFGDDLVSELFEEWTRANSPDIFDGSAGSFPDSASDTPSLCSDSDSSSENTEVDTIESSDEEEVSQVATLFRNYFSTHQNDLSIAAAQ